MRISPERHALQGLLLSSPLQSSKDPPFQFSAEMRMGLGGASVVLLYPAVSPLLLQRPASFPPVSNRAFQAFNPVPPPAFPVSRHTLSSSLHILVPVLDCQGITLHSITTIVAALMPMTLRWYNRIVDVVALRVLPAADQVHRPQRSHLQPAA